MIQTRLTDRFDLKHPIISAPMAIASGGALSAAVGRAGGLGLIGGGYGVADWVEAQLSAAGNQAVGCGFITWALGENPDVLDMVLDRYPKAIFLLFADPKPFAQKILNCGVPLICQVQTLLDAEHAADLGATVVVAQGGEAGGHGQNRGTMTLVPEVADRLAQSHADTLVVAAGGIADGRSLAACLMLGADGVLVGSRLWASSEALVHPNMHQAALAATGDQTVRSSVMDVARRLNWPERYTARVLQNGFTEQWHGNEAALIADQDAQSANWTAAWTAGDVDVANTFVGEVAGMIHEIAPAGDIIEAMMREAERLLSKTQPLDFRNRADV